MTDTGNTSSGDELLPIYELIPEAPGVGGPAAPKQRRKGRYVAVALAVALVAGISVAVTEIVSALSGTSTPGVESVLPSDTVAFVQASLDPNADQKIAAYDIGRKFPQVKHQISKSDPEGSLINYMLKQSGAPITWDEIHSWAGARVGAAAVLPADSKQPFWLALVQVKNSTKATKDLDELQRQGGVAYEFAHGYAYIAQHKADIDAALSDLQAHGSLAQQANFKLGAATVGDGDIFGGYVDIAAGSQLELDAAGAQGGLPVGELGFLQQNLKDAKGAITVHLRLNGGGAELDVDSYGLKATPTAQTADAVTHLPSDSIAAFELATGSQKTLQPLKQLPSSLTQPINDALSGVGLKFPDDILTMLGSDVAASVSASRGSPEFGVIVHGSNAAQGQSLVQRMLNRLAANGTDLPVTVSGDSDSYTVASSAAYASELTTGHLGDVALFKRAVPHAEGALEVVYVDFGGLAQLSGDSESGLKQFADLVAAAGFSFAQTSPTTMHGQLNVVFK